MNTELNNNLKDQEDNKNKLLKELQEFLSSNSTSDNTNTYNSNYQKTKIFNFCMLIFLPFVLYVEHKNKGFSFLLIVFSIIFIALLWTNIFSLYKEKTLLKKLNQSNLKLTKKSLYSMILSKKIQDIKDKYDIYKDIKNIDDDINFSVIKVNELLTDLVKLKELIYDIIQAEKVKK